MIKKGIMMYKITCYYGCFAKNVVPGGCLTRMTVDNSLTEYFDEYTVFETPDKWEAVVKFAREYNTSVINTNAFDFSEGCECVSVSFYRLEEYCNKMLTGIIFESDFQPTNVNK